MVSPLRSIHYFTEYTLIGLCTKLCLCAQTVHVYLQFVGVATNSSEFIGVATNSTHVFPMA